MYPQRSVAFDPREVTPGLPGFPTDYHLPTTNCHPMTALSVNLNKIALVRNSRNSGIPSVMRAATICLDAGADGITVHPRPDERHIRRSDVHDLKQMLSAEFNIEGNPLEPAFLDLVRDVKPTQCTLVPDARDQLTSDHGWNLQTQMNALRGIIAELKSLGIRVSLFMDADPAQMPLAKVAGADRVELYTGPYAEEFHAGHRDTTLTRYAAAAQAALNAGSRSVPGTRARRAGGLHRPCADCRRAGAWPGGIGAALPGNLPLLKSGDADRMWSQSGERTR
jgi:pyridoxine 5-phosphate synthase